MKIWICAFSCKLIISGIIGLTFAPKEHIALNGEQDPRPSDSFFICPRPLALLPLLDPCKLSTL